MCYYNPLHRSHRFINQYFRLTDQNSLRIWLNHHPNAKLLLGTMPCASWRKGPDASQMFALKYRVRRDLNIDDTLKARKPRDPLSSYIRAYSTAPRISTRGSSRSTRLARSPERITPPERYASRLPNASQPRNFVYRCSVFSIYS